MTRYLISFPSGAMDHIPHEEFPAVGEAAHAVVQEAMDAGVWVFGGGLAEDVDPVMVAGDGTITAGTYPQTKEFNGGFTVLDVPLGRRPWSEPRRSRSPAAVLKRSASSCPTQRWATDRSPKSPLHAQGSRPDNRLRQCSGISPESYGDSRGALRRLVAEPQPAGVVSGQVLEVIRNRTYQPRRS
jgi:hypothetical protein